MIFPHVKNVAPLPFCHCGVRWEICSYFNWHSLCHFQSSLFSLAAFEIILFPFIFKYLWCILVWISSHLSCLGFTPNICKTMSFAKFADLSGIITSNIPHSCPLSFLLGLKWYNIGSSIIARRPLRFCSSVFQSIFSMQFLPGTFSWSQIHQFYPLSSPLCYWACAMERFLLYFSVLYFYNFSFFAQIAFISQLLQ